MKAGREINALVAENVMGRAKNDNSVPNYSGDIVHACAVADFMVLHAKRFRVENSEYFVLRFDLSTKEWEAGFRSSDYDSIESWDHVACAETAPLAVSLMALMAAAGERK